MKNDKSLEEVWRWKDAAHKEYSGLDNHERIQRVNESAKKLLASYGIELPIGSVPEAGPVPMVAEKRSAYGGKPDKK